MRDPIIILIGRTIMNLGKYIVYSIMLNLRKGDDYLSDRMPIWFSNTRYYENKRIEDNALKSVVKIRVGEQNIKDFRGTDHTPLDLGYKEMKHLSKEHKDKKKERDETSLMRRFSEGEGDNYPGIVMNGNWKPIQR